MLLRGAQIVIECLLEQGVCEVFGYPGGAILGIYEALHEYSGRIRHTLMTHEQHAAHAADGYARASGKVGVCLATSGPGATNLLTGLSAAYMDSSPVVAITNNVAKAQIGTDSFQEIDIYGVSMPVTKHNFIVKEIRDLADTIRQAFFIAASGRPGPVLVDIPQDITAAKAEFSPKTPKKPVRRLHSDALDFAGAAFLIEESQRPLLLLGGGAAHSGARDAALALAQKIRAPIAQTLMATGCCDKSPQFAGMLGVYGSPAANALLEQCDLLIAVGTRFSDRTIPRRKALARTAKILHIDIDPAEINKNLTADLALMGDAREVLQRLLPLCSAKASGLEIPPRAEMPGQSGQRLTPEFLLSKLSSMAGAEQIYTTEVGQHQIWAAKHLEISGHRRFLTSGGLGTMGFGLGAAIGAARASGQRIINIAGDGSFLMNMAELSTAACYNLPIIEVVLDNRALGMVRQLQKNAHLHFSQVDFDRNMDYLALARAFGIPGYVAKTRQEAEQAFAQALGSGGPALIACQIPKNQLA